MTKDIIKYSLKSHSRWIMMESPGLKSMMLSNLAPKGLKERCQFGLYWPSSTLDRNPNLHGRFHQKFSIEPKMSGLIYMQKASAWRALLRNHPFTLV